MFGLIPSIYLRVAAYGLAAALIGTAGYKAGAHRWEARYSALQAQGWQTTALRAEVAQKALQSRLDEAEATSQNNARALEELHHETAAIAADRDRVNDLAHRLLERAARAARRPVVPQAADQPGAPRASEAGGDEPAAKLLVDAAAECRATAAQLNALIAQINPQL